MINELILLGCPDVLRCDYGTENSSLATIRIAFRYHNHDSMVKDKDFIYRPSKSNIVRAMYTCRCMYACLFSYKLILPSLHNLCLFTSLSLSFPRSPLSLWDTDSDQVVLPLCSQCCQVCCLLSICSKLEEAAELLLYIDSNNVLFVSFL